MQTTWIVQANMGSSEDVANLIEAVEGSGGRVEKVQARPFCPDVPDIECAGPVVLYGSGSLVEAARSRGRWSPGVFGDADSFSYAKWVEHYADLLLNSADAASMTTVGEYASSTLADEGTDVFVRPQHDTKAIPGMVWKAGAFREWCGRACVGGWENIGPETPIVVGRRYEIQAEWRMFVADGIVVSGTEYRQGEREARPPGGGARLPAEVVLFADRVAALWSPAPLYVLDICSSGDQLYVVEAQGFHSAGFYDALLDPIVEAVHRIAQRMWTPPVRTPGGPA